MKMRRETAKLMSKQHRSIVQGYTEMISRATGGELPVWMVKYDHYNSFIRGHVFMIRMPITDEWEAVTVDDKFFHSRTMPKAIHAKLDYWVKMRKLLEYGRDHSPMDRDLSPITPEEKSLFGVRANFPNPCIAGDYKGIMAGIAESHSKAWKKFQSSLLESPHAYSNQGSL